MVRAILCATIVAAFPLNVAAAAISEDIPIPGGMEAIVRAAGLPSTPDRPRFAAEIARLIFEVPPRQRQDPRSRFAWLTAHLNTVTRFQRALTRVAADGRISLAAASNGGVRSRLRELLEEIGLRLQDNRGKYTVESAGDAAANQRIQLLLDMGVDVSGLEAALNGGETVTLRVPYETVPFPLTAELWSKAVFGEQVDPADLFRVMMADERAALLCHGLAALDDATLEYIVAHPSMLRALYQRATVFAAFGSHLRIQGNRVVTPGEEHGDGARAVWEDLTHARVGDPQRFVAELFGRSEGRLAYLYDTVAELDSPRRAFALSLWIASPGIRSERVRSLAASAAASYPEWPTAERPFSRPLHDLATLLSAVDVNADGSPKNPSARRLWDRAFAGDDIPDDPARELRDIDRDGPIDAGWIAEVGAAVDVRLRARRLSQIAFGHRVFGAARADDAADVLVALRAFSRYRTVMLALEQMGLRTPSAYAAAARQAARLSRLDGGRAFVAFSQFQGSLALLIRLTAVRSVPPDRIEAVVTALSGVPLTDSQRFDGRVAAWLRGNLLAGQEDEGAEVALIGALAGPGGVEGAPPIAWEGDQYRVDFAAAEEQRLTHVRERQAGFSLDTALRLESIARRLAASAIDVDGVKAAAAALEALQADVPPRQPPTASDVVPGGSEDLPDPRRVVDEAIRELGRVVQPRDVRRAEDVSRDLWIASDVVLAEVLVSFAYAITLGDPDGVTLLGGDVARRHDFGIGSRVPGVAAEQPWSIPEQHYDPGIPWHVAGSLVGLDAALAPLALRRLSTDDLPGPPVLGSNDRETFARSVALLNPFALRDAERDTIVAAVALGRRRVSALKSAAEVGPVAAAVQMDGWRRRALQWTIAHEPERALSFFSMAELVMLGGGDLDGLHHWGTSMTPVWGCLCTRMPRPNTWRFVTGRPQTGVLATAVPDVGLHVAVALAELGLPAALARVVLGGAMQHFVDTVAPNDGNDWLALVRAAQAIPRERIEDYVAAATAGGPLVPAMDASSREP